MANRPSRNSEHLVHVGFGNFVSLSKVLAIVTPTSAPIQRMIREGKRKGSIIDSTSGRRTKAAVVLEGDKIVLVAITPEAVAGRVSGRKRGALE